MRRFYVLLAILPPVPYGLAILVVWIVYQEPTVTIGALLGWIITSCAFAAFAGVMYYIERGEILVITKSRDKTLDN